LLWSIKALAASELINGLAFKKRTRGKIGNYISACTTTVDCLIFTDSEGHDEEFEGDSNFWARHDTSNDGLFNNNKKGRIGLTVNLYADANNYNIPRRVWLRYL